MYMLFNHPTKGWSLGLIFDDPSVPEKLKIYLYNTRNQNNSVKELAHWCKVHKVKGVAFSLGSFKERIVSYRFRRQFNKFMNDEKMSISLMDFAKAINK